ncbi:alpha-1,3-mannosyl-glycoprotein 4-beta-N-acetylglucosaminyltransferase C [Lingula anatina]|uniref:Alpha-1,3-mannosyl-glycoprotein 4-beta-N-acetylglucosaminyltransferase C n=1 Tax=Lingula anatina TaxID=7574 RepID=A0A1S3JLB6_LINAN|nr:alpha-1,3-mannosyl-glycoprotein 4-beta-N-acetylglucosaminyltransferase C [Lingula anatina]XP_013411163.1 alpha-1,3-mannosyl-glycoprotein 4-beta-N-acetylglucosaminyltransferase C [Lingula anatina]XP_013411164.1 alpha-1,3-mannosyl-glycoprotein 4-beta-N-acetylglucosaminyltransferase C [Lingula anatina]|eukprot:XP_013411162.1 alpha-1,3-mannosyl-glycoprotein 4-beta-N-acetylglucosaminyltransferase C [Lingula anatina]
MHKWRRGWLSGWRVVLLGCMLCAFLSGIFGLLKPLKHGRRESNQKRTGEVLHEGQGVRELIAAADAAEKLLDAAMEKISAVVEKSSSALLTEEELVVHLLTRSGFSITNRKSPWEKMRENLVEVAGIQRKERGFLTIGISSVKRSDNAQYLHRTIQSVIMETSEEEKKEIVVVIFLADFDDMYKNRTKTQLSENFKEYLDSGFLQIVEAERSFYPPVHKLNHNFNYSSKLMQETSKHNVDLAFMSFYAYNMSQYYLHLNDDVLCAQNFIKDIKHFIHQMQSYSWTMLQFSFQRCLGNLLRSEDLPQLGQFLLLFFEQQPCDRLITHFLKSKNQFKSFLKRPTLFQQQDLQTKQTNGSDDVNAMHFKQKDYLPLRGENPPALCSTNLNAASPKHVLNHAYLNDGNFFWAKSPKRDGYILVKFLELQRIYAAEVYTGHVLYKDDFLYNGIIEVGKASPESRNITKNASAELNPFAVCGEFVAIGKINSPFFYYRDMSKHLDFPAACVRITIIENQLNWLIIQNIKIESENAKSVN